VRNDGAENNGVFFERAEVTDDFIASVVDHWLAARPAASQVTRLSPPVAL
jgi:hypothetical protein